MMMDCIAVLIQMNEDNGLLFIVLIKPLKIKFTFDLVRYFPLWFLYAFNTSALLFKSQRYSAQAFH